MDCHICGRPQAGEGSILCSYPHGRLPVAPETDGGFAAWEMPNMPNPEWRADPLESTPVVRGAFPPDRGND